MHDICGCSDAWQPGNIVARDIAQIREQIGSDRVLLGLSGGVDSSVVAALLHEAIGEQLHCVYVDTGLTTGETYFYVVQTVTGVVSSENSSEVEVLVPARRRRR